MWIDIGHKSLYATKKTFVNAFYIATIQWISHLFKYSNEAKLIREVIITTDMRAA